MWRSYLVSLTLCLLFFVLATNARPSWQCRVCEDVVQTFHDKFRCAGHFLDWGDVNSPDIHGCEGPKLDCDRLAGSMRKECTAMENEFFMDGTYRRIIWENMMLTNDVYGTCVKLGKCKEDPFPPRMLDKCHKLFLDPSCGNNVACDKFPLFCTESCYVCNWLVKDYPLFQEICKPDSARLPQEVVLPDDLPPGAFAELAETVRTTVRRRALAEQKSGSQATINPGLSNTRSYDPYKLPPRKVNPQMAARDANNAKDENPVTKLRTGFVLPQSCFDQWMDIRRMPKGRYFAEWKTYVGVLNQPVDMLKGEMWDANVACKCLGYCEITRFEDLSLTEACRYEENDEKMMRELFGKEGDIRIFESKEKGLDADPSVSGTPGSDATTP